jgi:hypothetical protein
VLTLDIALHHVLFDRFSSSVKLFCDAKMICNVTFFNSFHHCIILTGTSVRIHVLVTLNEIFIPWVAHLEALKCATALKFTR